MAVGFVSILTPLDARLLLGAGRWRAVWIGLEARWTGLSTVGLTEHPDGAYEPTPTLYGLRQERL